MNAYTEIDPLAPEDPANGPSAYQVLPAHDKAGNLTFSPLAKVAGQPATCGTGIPACDEGDYPCGPGLEYVYDAENRLVTIHRDTNDTAGSPIGSSAEPLVMEFDYDP